MSLKIDHTPDHLKASLVGAVTSAEIAELRSRLTADDEPDLVHLEEVEAFPSGHAFMISGSGKFPKKRVAFVCTNALTFGFARMVASYFDMDAYRIFSSTDDARSWLLAGSAALQEG